MWEYVLEGLERRYWRRDGVEDSDLHQVKMLLAEAKRKEELQK